MQRHVISARQFGAEDIIALFEEADRMEKIVAYGGCDALDGKVMATLFYEPSTRTRLSFETAMLRLGGRYVSTENAREFSSVSKGETLEDTIRTVGCFADVIVLRHFEEGAARRAADISSVPIVNAGDGIGEHPTQALLDLYTIFKELGRLEGLTITCVGDLANGRTVHSLVRLAANFPIERFIFIAPPEVRMKDDIIRDLQDRGILCREGDQLQVAMSHSDVVYQTRIQKERFPSAEAYEALRGRYVIDREAMTHMKPEGILMHPLPRVGEIAIEVDADPRAAYFRQVKNGLFMRMALLQKIFA
ncbi:MAG TPA: aspartate carbamoyltransferase [Candidatus Baltobacteraceae bacterium]|nr:aspartate carbamoyltransferase [Candidatus Baltobacteraceae bacterium]